MKMAEAKWNSEALEVVESHVEAGTLDDLRVELRDAMFCTLDWLLTRVCWRIVEDERWQAAWDLISAEMGARRVAGVYGWDEVAAIQAKRDAEARAEYNRRRSEIAAIVFASLFPISGNKEYSRDAEIAFDAAEAFLAEEARRNGESQ